MGKTSIEWTSTILPDGTVLPGYSFNPWVGCEKISPACDHCYAESWAKRAGNPELWQGKRRRTTAQNWRQPLIWNRKAEAAGVRARVFCASLADVFDNVVPPEWRADLFRLIRETPHLDWLLLTKRIGNAKRLVEQAADWHFDHGDRNVAGWLTDWYRHDIAPLNVWLGATVANQEEANRDISKLLATSARVRFLSMEPLLGPVYLGKALGTGNIDWVIVGGESGGSARPMSPQWVTDLRDQCRQFGVAFFFKQWGEWAPIPNYQGVTSIKARLFVTGATVYRVGKKRAGREIDGRIWDHFPVPA